MMECDVGPSGHFFLLSFFGGKSSVMLKYGFLMRIVLVYRREDLSEEKSGEMGRMAWNYKLSSLCFTKV